jgi:hypothetical protein
VSERESLRGSERLVGIFVGIVLEHPRRGIKLFEDMYSGATQKRESPGNKGKKMWQMGKKIHREKGERGKERKKIFFFILLYCNL